MKIPKRIVAVNIFGAMGYMGLLVVWALFIAVILAFVIEPSITQRSMELTRTADPIDTVTQSSSMLQVASYVITALVVIVSIGVVVTLPYFIGMWGGRIVKRLMAIMKVVPSRRHLFLTKSGLMSLPLVGLMIVNYVVNPADITFGALYIATVGLAIIGIGLFFVQLILARQLNVAAEQLW